jgi:2-dehydro-3-deoxygluconokinase
VNSGKIDREGYINVAQQLTKRFGCKAIAITLRGSISASENNWAGMLYEGEQAYFSQRYLIKIVDRVGGGDSFGGAFIHAYQKMDDRQDMIEFAVSASCLKQTIEQDFNLVSEAEVLSLMRGNASGRVQR